MQNRYGFGTSVSLIFDAAVDEVSQELSKEGFGVLAEIDVAATMKKKLDKDMPPYRILGACNPPLAHQALTADPSIALLLPCNVIVRQDGVGGVHVEVMDPQPMFDLVGKQGVAPLAAEVRERPFRVMNVL
jgi:uncharacterized protein (DUF302 family)